VTERVTHPNSAPIQETFVKIYASVTGHIWIKTKIVFCPYFGFHSWQFNEDPYLCHYAHLLHAMQVFCSLVKAYRPSITDHMIRNHHSATVHIHYTWSKFGLDRWRIRTQHLKFRPFNIVCSDKDSEYENLIFQTEFHWLFSGNLWWECLKRVKKFQLFLSEKKQNSQLFLTYTLDAEAGILCKYLQ